MFCIDNVTIEHTMEKYDDINIEFGYGSVSFYINKNLTQYNKNRNQLVDRKKNFFHEKNTIEFYLFQQQQQQHPICNLFKARNNE